MGEIDDIAFKWMVVAAAVMLLQVVGFPLVEMLMVTTETFVEVNRVAFEAVSVTISSTMGIFTSFLIPMTLTLAVFVVVAKVARSNAAHAGPPPFSHTISSLFEFFEEEEEEHEPTPVELVKQRYVEGEFDTVLEFEDELEEAWIEQEGMGDE